MMTTADPCILAIDNGGWSMEPYIDLVRTLFQYARAQFRELRTLYFHNAIYGCLWEDPQRLLRAVPLEELLRLDPRTRFLIVGDGNMAPSELTAVNGSIRFGERSGIPGVERLRSIAQGFPHAIWINPIPARHWDYSRSITIIREILPMFELTLDGLEKAVAWSMRKA